ncbi:hypothetical protein BBW65_06600 [Helicobacter enhydrae]|uniref:NYN domain-containing protein n=1 Tax=Helicobacter enhydrae TaxID=222136 RepID=A0A1B1U6X5_9HELI|nr:NYN domain-containing protein [Helicobacter enhydrae]ANV98486.1 hypothetical protein BBW65_06600 [Helicobacter enhydrae]
MNKMLEISGGKKKVALFIDSENISYRLISEVIKRLEDFGEICIKKAYGDWRRSELRGWDEVLQKYSIEPIHIVTGSGNKSNSSDIKIAIDVMNVLYSDRMHCIALATSDSDFAPLAQEIRTRGLQAVGFGESKSRDSLRNAFSSFEEVGVEDRKIDLSANHYLMSILRSAVEVTMNDEGKSLVSRVGLWLKEQYFKTASSYGKETWGEVFRTLEDFEITYGGRDHNVMFVEYRPKKQRNKRR